MKRHGILVLIAATVAAACAPNYESGKTQCSAKKECPSGLSCSDDGTSGTHYCFDNKKLGCPSGSSFYCSQSNTCWAKPGVCSTVTYCGTAKHPGNVICALPNYHPDCNGDACLPNSIVVADASPGSGGRDAGAGGAIGTGGITAKGGAGGSTSPITGSGGRTGYGGTIGYGGATGYGGSSGIRDAGPEVPGLGGSYPSGGTVGRGGTFGTGGLYLTGGTVGRGGATGTGGIRGTGGTTGYGGSTGASLCSGATYACDYRTSAGDCGLANGCVWNSSTLTCGGTPSACSTYTSSTWCIYNGCTWSGAMACSPTSMTPYCAEMISGSTDTCDICISNSCCTQLTNCMNDDLCSTDFSGPLWQRYVECLINCCGSAGVCDWY